MNVATASALINSIIIESNTYCLLHVFRGNGLVALCRTSKTAPWSTLHIVHYRMDIYVKLTQLLACTATLLAYEWAHTNEVFCNAFYILLFVYADQLMTTLYVNRHQMLNVLRQSQRCTQREPKHVL